jgi:acetoin utilization protein AcuB
MSQDGKSVRGVMSRKLITLELEDQVRKAYQIMQEQGIRHLPVTSPQGDVVGILSDRDTSRAMKPQLQGAIEREEPEFLKNSLVRDYMSWPVRTVSESATLGEVARIMVEEKISALLVQGAHQRTLGIVTSQDLLQVFCEFLKNDPSQSARPLSMLEEFGGTWFGIA